MTMTRTRRKQKQEMVKKAIREAEERQSELRQQFPLRATAIVQQAAYEPALFHHQLNVQQQEKNAEGEGKEPNYKAAFKRDIGLLLQRSKMAIISKVPNFQALYIEIGKFLCFSFRPIFMY